MNPFIIVQASSKSWSGSVDLCMNEIDGKPVVFHTINKIYDLYPNAKVHVAAPEFDKNGELEFLKNEFNTKYFKLLYAFNESPLKRLVEITKDLSENDYFIRIDGLNKWFLSESMKDLFSYNSNYSCDCLKFPDDFPVQFTFEQYKVAGIRRVLEMNPDDIFHVHPQFYMMINQDNFIVKTNDHCTNIEDSYLTECRAEAKKVYIEPRLEVNEKKITAGDQLSFHYELSKQYINNCDKVLDIACGEGYGTNMISIKASLAIGGDLDKVSIDKANLINKGSNNIDFKILDITDIDFSDNSFDVCISMETIEHVDADLMLSELKRILKPDGKLILSTPQNSLGHIPVNAEHLIEYSYEELNDLLTQYFTIEEFISIKRGCIIIDDDNLGTNSFVILKNE